jgi:hypothetical protein
MIYGNLIFYQKYGKKFKQRANNLNQDIDINA